jgi:hypothetical protein
VETFSPARIMYSSGGQGGQAAEEAAGVQGGREREMVVWGREKTDGYMAAYGGLLRLNTSQKRTRRPVGQRMCGL